MSLYSTPLACKHPKSSTKVQSMKQWHEINIENTHLRGTCWSGRSRKGLVEWTHWCFIGKEDVQIVLKVREEANEKLGAQLAFFGSAFFAHHFMDSVQQLQGTDSQAR